MTDEGHSLFLKVKDKTNSATPYPYTPHRLKFQFYKDIFMPSQVLCQWNLSGMTIKISLGQNCFHRSVSEIFEI